MRTRHHHPIHHSARSGCDQAQTKRRKNINVVALRNRNPPSCKINRNECRTRGHDYAALAALQENEPYKRDKFSTNCDVLVVGILDAFLLTAGTGSGGTMRRKYSATFLAVPGSMALKFKSTLPVQYHIEFRLLRHQ
jgi:hypothetical protein